MARIAVLWVLVTGLLLAPVMAETDVTGKWQITTSTPRGERTSAIEFVQTGQTLKVIMEGREGGQAEGAGTISGSSISWSITRETPRGTFTMTYTGTVAGDSAMEGEVQFGQMGSGKWTATK